MPSGDIRQTYASQGSNVPAAYKFDNRHHHPPSTKLGIRIPLGNFLRYEPKIDRDPP